MLDIWNALWWGLLLGQAALGYKMGAQGCSLFQEVYCSLKSHSRSEGSTIQLVQMLRHKAIRKEAEGIKRWDPTAEVSSFDHSKLQLALRACPMPMLHRNGSAQLFLN